MGHVLKKASVCSLLVLRKAKKKKKWIGNIRSYWGLRYQRIAEVNIYSTDIIIYFPSSFVTNFILRLQMSSQELENLLTISSI